ncbi:hypothetical protein AB0B25_31475 [Nocardia sp. NPDC049190]|uniref:hypothetical protein n=1 Tax=Nocardia sp. NPDC049190 TaxID=3155650 RepID=UPI0033CDCFE7
MTQNIIPSLAYEDAPAAMNWLRDAFDFKSTVVVPGPDGTIAHAELKRPEGGFIMILSTQISTRRNRSPRSIGGTAESVYTAVLNIDTA